MNKLKIIKEKSIMEILNLCLTISNEEERIFIVSYVEYLESRKIRKDKKVWVNIANNRLIKFIFEMISDEEKLIFIIFISNRVLDVDINYFINNPMSVEEQMIYINKLDMNTNHGEQKVH